MGDPTDAPDARPGAVDMELRAEVERLRALVDCFPAGYLEECAAILRVGGERHGCRPSESGGGQTASDHAIHVSGHLHAIHCDIACARPIRPDPDSGRSQFAHAGARSALGWACEREAARLGGSGQ